MFVLIKSIAYCEQKMVKSQFEDNSVPIYNLDSPSRVYPYLLMFSGFNISPLNSPIDFGILGYFGFFLRSSVRFTDLNFFLDLWGPPLKSDMQNMDHSHSSYI